MSQPRELQISAEHSRLPEPGSNSSSSEGGVAVTHNLHFLFGNLLQTHSASSEISITLVSSAFVIQSGPLQGKIGHGRNKLRQFKTFSLGQW